MLSTMIFGAETTILAFDFTLVEDSVKVIVFVPTLVHFTLKVTLALF